jgi:RNA-binding protein YhbY
MKFQIGKAGLTEGVVESLKLYFKNVKVVRVSVLRNCAPTKDKVKQIADELVQRLGEGYRYATVGFTIILRRGKMEGA